MKRFNWILVMIVCGCFATGPAYAEEPLQIGIGEMPPYVSKSMEHYGFFCRLITEIFTNAGLEVEYKVVPWKRALIMTQHGDLDATPGWYRTPEREKVYYISDPLVDDDQTFFHLKSYQFEWNTMEDLHGIRIGATLGYDYGEAFARAENEQLIQVERIPTDEQNFKKLLAKRIDIFPMNTITGYYLLHKLFKPEVVDVFTNHPKPLRTATLHLLFSKNVARNERLLSVFNEGLQALKKSGVYDRYLEEIQSRGEN